MLETPLNYPCIFDFNLKYIFLAIVADLKEITDDDLLVFYCLSSMTVWYLSSKQTEFLLFSFKSLACL